MADTHTHKHKDYGSAHGGTIFVQLQ